MGTLTRTGYIWVLLSVTSAFLACSGFYLPFWIQGRILGRVDAYFNSFRRCNYPQLGSQGIVEIVTQCARYSRWRDIPSGWWQVSAVLVGVGSALALMLAVVAVSACFVKYVIHVTTARLAGGLQLIAGMMVCGGLLAFPLGWDNKEIKDSCGASSQVYALGNCKLSWSLYLLVLAILLLVACFALSSTISKVNYCCSRSCH